jgi:hypothetical protein
MYLNKPHAVCSGQTEIIRSALRHTKAIQGQDPPHQPVAKTVTWDTHYEVPNFTPIDITPIEKKTVTWDTHYEVQFITPIDITPIEKKPVTFDTHHDVQFTTPMVKSHLNNTSFLQALYNIMTCGIGHRVIRIQGRASRRYKKM